MDEKECSDIVLSVWIPNQWKANLSSVLDNISDCGRLLDSWNITKRRELQKNILAKRDALKEVSSAAISAS